MNAEDKTRLRSDYRNRKNEEKRVLHTHYIYRNMRRETSINWPGAMDEEKGEREREEGTLELNIQPLLCTRLIS